MPTSNPTCSVVRSRREKTLRIPSLVCIWRWIHCIRLQRILIVNVDNEKIGVREFRFVCMWAKVKRTFRINLCIPFGFFFEWPRRVNKQQTSRGKTVACVPYRTSEAVQRLIRILSNSLSLQTIVVNASTLAVCILNYRLAWILFTSVYRYCAHIVNVVPFISDYNNRMVERKISNFKFAFVHWPERSNA